LSDIQIIPVTNRSEREAFIALPYALHRQDPLWVPVLRMDVRALLDPKKNPFFEHAEAQYFLARRGSQVVGRIAAIHNRLHNEFHNDRVGFFGFFEAIHEQAVADLLFKTAADWLRARNLDVMRGPTSFSTNDECGLLVDGFETPPAIMMPHNPRYYIDLVERAGFKKAKDLRAYQSTGLDLPPRLVEGARLLEKRYGITTRMLDMKHFDGDVAIIKDLYNRAWERNWGFIPMTERELDHLVKQLKPIVVPEIVPFAFRKGEPIAFGVALPDFNVALKKNPSGRLFPGILKVLWASRKIHRVRIPLLGTLPEWRGRGVDALLYKHIWEHGRAKGYDWGEASWILEDNSAMHNGLERMGFRVYKVYRLYDRPVSVG
jgi:GNAT superfamily N-acetyltransferase